MLLNLFLERRYEKTDVIFIRHTHEAEEVGEEEFFYNQRSGGTVVSTALQLAHDIIKDRYTSGQWNIYIAHASDGENYSGDSKKCVTMLESVLMPLIQYFFYVEILDESDFELFRDESAGAELWKALLPLRHSLSNVAMKRVAAPGHIYPVFRSLFEKRDSKGGTS
jgi:uncharacterized protein